jgi:deoxyxylulose-5-phosphate synthase
VLAHLAERGPAGVRVERAGIPDEFVEHAPQADLRARFRLDAAGLAARARALLKTGTDLFSPSSARGGGAARVPGK